MNDPNTATVRTTWNVVVLMVLTWIVTSITDKEVATDDPRIIIAAGVIVGIFYRLSVVLSETVPYVGYVLFGVNRSPAYTTPPPDVPALADEDHGH